MTRVVPFPEALSQTNQSASCTMVKMYHASIEHQEPANSKTKTLTVSANNSGESLQMLSTTLLTPEQKKENEINFILQGFFFNPLLSLYSTKPVHYIDFKHGSCTADNLSLCMCVFAAGRMHEAFDMNK